MMDGIASSSRNVRAEVENEEIRNDGNDDVKKFVPPPEYDENDSSWTLKYREPAPGLVELMEHSRVYINFDKLAECQEWSNDSKTFAANLLTEIFTESALTTCTWSGLDEHATNILLKFVVEYGQIRDWMRTDYQCILKSIRQVMLEMRCARKKKEEKAEEELNENGSKNIQFLLPPEKDKNNSKWTLKYREYAPGLGELIYDSCVYVGVIQLAKCKRLAKDSITLARLLLHEIFTTRALSICSLSTTHGTNIRHTLDENAMTTLLKFVAENEMKNKWVSTEKYCILRSIQQKLEVLRRVQRIEEQDKEYDSGDHSRSFFSFKKKYLKNHKFRNLSPEYEVNDSKWTLKYREPAPGLVELMEHSGVYVNADKLAECKRLSNDCPTLARKLLTEIFTKNALGTCSLSKKNYECYKTNSETFTNQPKPELDAHAEIILLNFVDEYGLEMGWPVLDFSFTRKSMISKMSDLEGIYLEKEEERRCAADDKKNPMC